MARNGMLITAIAAVVVLGVSAVGLRFFRTEIETVVMQQTSDAASIAATFTVGGDPWIGYAPLGSAALQASLRTEGIDFRYESPDVVDYAERMRQVRDGELDFAVATVDANLLNTPDFNRGGVIVAVLDQSTGGDALVCDLSRINSIDAFNTERDWKVAFTPDSPSHQILRAIGNDFGVDAFLQEGDWQVETNGSADARSALEAGQVDCAVLWQPDVTRATRGSNRFGTVFSSADADGLIVDVLLVNRTHLSRSSPLRPHIQTVLRHYFETVRRFSEEPEFALEQATAYLREYEGTRYEEADVSAMMAGVTWVNLTENAESWFGVGGDNPYFKLEDAHDFALTIIRAERGADYLRRFRPVGIMNGEFVEALYEVHTIEERNATITDPLELRFPAIAAWEWNSLVPQGTLRSRRIVFEPGSLQMEDSTVTALREAMNDFKRYPRSRLQIHVGFDPEAGQTAADTAETRAEAVKAYLIDTYGIDENRIRAVTEAAPREDGEGGRAYQSRLRGVGLVLVRSSNET